MSNPEKKDKRKKESHELVGVKRIIDKMRKDDEILLLTFITNEKKNNTTPRYSFSPSGKIVPMADAKKVISAGLVIPKDAGLFNDLPQTWALPHV